MKVIEHLERADEPLISFELIPPLRGGDVQELLDLLEELVAFDPPFIDITSHAAEVVYEETPDGLARRVKRKRPGTLGVCALIQHQFGIDAVPHVLCTGFTREETEDFLIELRYLGIDNVLAVRGDDHGYEKPLQFGRSANRYAIELVAQVVAMNEGRYLEEDLLDAEPTDFCIGVAGYPEKHFEAPNLLTDVRWAKRKLEIGADYLVTQMFYDNSAFFDFVALCREEGIEAPIIPGLKVLTKRSHLQLVPRTFHCDIPPELAERVRRAETEEQAFDVGVDWTVRQVEELLDAGVPSIHFYVMQSARAVKTVLERLELPQVRRAS